MKTEFELESQKPTKGKIRIIGRGPEHSPYVSIEVETTSKIPYAILTRNLIIKDKDLERFAVNILKALKSKKLKLI